MNDLKSFLPKIDGSTSENTDNTVLPNNKPTINSYFEQVYLINMVTDKHKLNEVRGKLRKLGIKFKLINGINILYDTNENGIPATWCVERGHGSSIKEAAMPYMEIFYQYKLEVGAILSVPIDMYREIGDECIKIDRYYFI